MSGAGFLCSIHSLLGYKGRFLLLLTLRTELIFSCPQRSLLHTVHVSVRVVVPHLEVRLLEWQLFLALLLPHLRSLVPSINQFLCFFLSTYTLFDAWSSFPDN